MLFDLHVEIFHGPKAAEGNAQVFHIQHQALFLPYICRFDDLLFHHWASFPASAFFPLKKRSFMLFLQAMALGAELKSIMVISTMA